MFQRLSLAPLILLGLVAGCGGSSDDEDDPNTMRMGPDDSNDPGEMTPAYPDGVADPCATSPDTGFVNDELCIAPPPSDVGFQLHFGPEAVDYDDPEVLEEFVIAPNEEETVCQYRTSPNEDVRYYRDQHTRIRSGTHHMILYRAVTDTVDPPPDGTVVPDNCGPGEGYAFFSGAQAALGPEGGTLDVGTGDAPENEGLAYSVNPKTSFGIEMHYVNLTEKPLLREGWTNLIYAPEDEVEDTISAIFFIGGLSMNVPPKSTQVVEAGPCEREEEVRILGITGHAHAHNTRFTAFLERADGASEMIYESYDWEEPLNARFDSVTENFEPGDGTRNGAHSGILTMQPGDKMTWECEVENTLDQPLRFENEAYTAEMCNVFGFYVPGDSGTWSCLSFGGG